MEYVSHGVKSPLSDVVYHDTTQHPSEGRLSMRAPYSVSINTISSSRVFMGRWLLYALARRLASRSSGSVLSLSAPASRSTYTGGTGGGVGEGGGEGGRRMAGGQWASTEEEVTWREERGRWRREGKGGAM